MTYRGSVFTRRPSLTASATYWTGAGRPCHLLVTAVCIHLCGSDRRDRGLAVQNRAMSARSPPADHGIGIEEENISAGKTTPCEREVHPRRRSRGSTRCPSIAAPASRAIRAISGIDELSTT